MGSIKNAAIRIKRKEKRGLGFFGQPMVQVSSKFQILVENKI